MITSLISAIIIGAIIGALARLVLPGRQDIGMLLTIVIGIVGALIGTALARAIHQDNTNGIDWIEHILQVAVAAVGVAIVAGMKGSNRTRI